MEQWGLVGPSSLSPIIMGMLLKWRTPIHKVLDELKLLQYPGGPDAAGLGTPIFSSKFLGQGLAFLFIKVPRVNIFGFVRSPDFYRNDSTLP